MQDKSAVISVAIRWMILHDLSEVARIENLCFFKPLSSEEIWTVAQKRDHVAMVAEHGDLIVGFIVYELGKTYFHIVDLAVRPSFQREGIGARLVEKLTQKLGGSLRKRVQADVAESNLSAQLFFRSQGFKAEKIFRGGAGHEDAYRFIYRKEVA